MTNKELAAALRLCGGTTGVEECRAECPFFRGADVGQCVPVMTAACADALANSESHVAALQKEIEKLREQLILRNDEVLKLREELKTPAEYANAPAGADEGG